MEHFNFRRIIALSLIITTTSYVTLPRPAAATRIESLDAQRVKRFEHGISVHGEDSRLQSTHSHRHRHKRCHQHNHHHDLASSSVNHQERISPKTRRRSLKQAFLSTKTAIKHRGKRRHGQDSSANPRADSTHHKRKNVLMFSIPGTKHHAKKKNNGNIDVNIHRPTLTSSSIGDIPTRTTTSTTSNNITIDNNNDTMNLSYGKVLAVLNVARKASNRLRRRVRHTSLVTELRQVMPSVVEQESHASFNFVVNGDDNTNNNDSPTSFSLFPSSDIASRRSATTNNNNNESNGNGNDNNNNNRKKGRGKGRKRPVANAAELQQAVLDDGVAFKDVQLEIDLAEKDVQDMLSHDVLQILAQRFHDPSSKPGARNDDASVALAIEGGGMRGCVSAGMAAAIASLGLSDAFDSIYGSSAGSVIGAYMVSRQMCVDVYVDILPAAQTSFVCKKRLLKSLAKSAMQLFWSNKVLSKLPGVGRSQQAFGVGDNAIIDNPYFQNPGMNISFVLDGVMGQQHGIRPLDIDSFEQNDVVQKLRIASSCVGRDGLLYSKCLRTEHFFAASSDSLIDKQDRMFACLQASMTVPGATGPPVMIHDCPHFDAFCTEPLPYRSAVAEGATHVLVLCSRPEGWEPKTKPGVYEKGIAPLYFHSNNLPQVARFFERGGQQYIYAEDILTLEEGKLAVTRGGEPIAVPPADILYGVDSEQEERLNTASKKDRSTWNRAHLLPLKVSSSVPELPTLEQDQVEVIKAVRAGYAAAFDLLVPALGIEDRVGELTGDEAARLMFPDAPEDACPKTALDTKVSVQGYPILEREQALLGSTGGATAFRNPARGGAFSTDTPTATSPTSSEEDLPCAATYLLESLPGFQDGKFEHLAKGLHTSKVSSTSL